MIEGATEILLEGIKLFPALMKSRGNKKAKNRTNFKSTVQAKISETVYNNQRGENISTLATNYKEKIIDDVYTMIIQTYTFGSKAEIEIKINSDIENLLYNNNAINTIIEKAFGDEWKTIATYYEDKNYQELTNDLQYYTRNYSSFGYFITIKAQTSYIHCLANDESVKIMTEIPNLRDNVTISSKVINSIFQDPNYKFKYFWHCLVNDVSKETNPFKPKEGVRSAMFRTTGLSSYNYPGYYTVQSWRYLIGNKIKEYIETTKSFKEELSTILSSETIDLDKGEQYKTLVTDIVKEFTATKTLNELINANNTLMETPSTEMYSDVLQEVEKIEKVTSVLNGKLLSNWKSINEKFLKNNTGGKPKRKTRKSKKAQKKRKSQKQKRKSNMFSS